MEDSYILPKKNLFSLKLKPKKNTFNSYI